MICRRLAGFKVGKNGEPALMPGSGNEHAVMALNTSCGEIRRDDSHPDSDGPLSILVLFTVGGGIHWY